MGQKSNPIAYRIGFNKTWDSRWFAKKDKYVQFLVEDVQIRNYIKKNLRTAAVSKVVIERSGKKVSVSVHSARPGVLIGKKGADIDKIKNKVVKITGGDTDVFINVVEVKRPEVDAQLVADGIAHQLEKRVSFRRAMKRAIQSCLKFGAKGIKVSCGGRLGGVDIARTERYKEGRIPLHTLRSDIDYAISRANTTYGVIGVKVHIYKGEKITY
ncbi:MAG: 30S ribosomal protein S3 [Rickettsiales bacterium]|nr:30S ribosomal protein S3 [Rickettsiales bacterium]